MVKFSKNELDNKDTKLNFPSFKENIHGLLAGFWFFNTFHKFPHIFGVYGPIFKNLVVYVIKITFPDVLRNYYDL